ncbi:ferric siderophore transport system, periplasmic binding protein tonb [hydrocarbon metagenome]|uniref:Ferric siderophore transport system, periplasmic binding protein tonb n=1 Tax=hydrocarbon metagenome TaxID=938273 RepID=A0A0W8FPJ1_9ZZZZ
MRIIKQTNNTNKFVPAICFSLLIHLAAAAFLVLFLSNNVPVQKLKGLNLVWVSLDDGNKLSKFELQSNSIVRPSPVMEQMAEEKINIEIQSISTDTIQKTEAPPTKELTNIVSLAKTGLSSATREQTNNTDGYSINKNAGKASNLDTTIAYPLYKKNTPPVYPAIARIRGYEGIVLLSAEVLPDGRVGNMKIRKSSGYAILDRSAMEAVRPWKFEPAKKSGNPFTVWVDLPIKFILHSQNSTS